MDADLFGAISVGGGRVVGRFRTGSGGGGDNLLLVVDKARCGGQVSRCSGKVTGDTHSSLSMV